MGSFRTLFFGLLLFILTSGITAVEAAYAQPLQFRGHVLDGPLADQTIKGFCEIDLTGDPQSQTAPCTFSLVSRINTRR